MSTFLRGVTAMLGAGGVSSTTMPASVGMPECYKHCFVDLLPCLHPLPPTYCAERRLSSLGSSALPDVVAVIFIDKHVSSGNCKLPSILINHFTFFITAKPRQHVARFTVLLRVFTRCVRPSTVVV